MIKSFFLLMSPAVKQKRNIATYNRAIWRDDVWIYSRKYFGNTNHVWRNQLVLTVISFIQIDLNQTCSSPNQNNIIYMQKYLNHCCLFDFLAYQFVRVRKNVDQCWSVKNVEECLSEWGKSIFTKFRPGCKAI